MLTYPDIDPVAISLGPLQVHWYGLMYLLAFLIAWFLAQLRNNRYHLNWTSEQINDVVFYAALGVILGGRIGYVMFYTPQAFLVQPWVVFELWKGGMSFHGGLLGVILAVWFFAKQSKKTFLNVTDFIAPLVPLGLAAGRIGNFINGELWGRPTNVPWAMIFPEIDGQPRHPSQLYEFGLEGILLFVIIWCYAAKPRRPGRVSAVFLIGYAISRIIVECFREPDNQLGFIAFNWLTMGQLLSFPMLIIGLWLWMRR